MKALILTCNTGEGHNSSAAAIKESLNAHNINADIVDALGFFSARASQFISNWHVRIYRRSPRIFRNGYAYAEHHSVSLEDKNWPGKTMAGGAGHLYELILREAYDEVICVHVIAAQLVTELQRKHPLPCHTSFIATDYTCSPFTGDSTMDTYFIPHKALTGEFIEAGIPREKIVASGLPVRRAFQGQTAKTAAKKQLGLPLNLRNVLLMCGSMGCGPMEKLTRGLATALPDDAMVTVVCGSNEKLYASLSKIRATNVRLYGYTRGIPLLMDSAELFLTKPGGISISEAAAKGLPMLFLDVVGGCESANLNFFANRGWAEVPATPKRLIRRCAALLETPATLTAKTGLLKRDFRGDAAERIAAHLYHFEPTETAAAVNAS